MIDTNRESTLNTFKDLKGEMVLVSRMEHQVWQFVAIAEDDDDYLYVLYDGRKLVLSTILDRMIPLKGKIDSEDYESIVRNSKMNFFSSDNFWGAKEGDDVYELAVNSAINHKASLIKDMGDGIRYLSDFEWDFK